MPRYLVTGGAGFIGAHLVGALVRRGDSVRVLDDFSTGTAANLAFALDREVAEPEGGGDLRYGNVEISRGDIRDPAACERACHGAEIVLHQAAMRSVPRSVEDPVGANEVNVTGTLHMLRASARAGVRRFVYASSSAVYGEDPSLPKQEDQVPRPISPYAVSKLAGEHYCRVFARVYGLPTTVLRYFNVFGPLQDPHSAYAAVMPLFIARALEGRPLEIHGDGLQSRDFTYVDNVVSASLLAADGPNLGGDPVNVACGERFTLIEVVEAVAQITGRSVEVRHTGARLGDARHTQADISRARALLGYEPLVGFREGLERTVAFFSKQQFS